MNAVDEAHIKLMGIQELEMRASATKTELLRRSAEGWEDTEGFVTTEELSNCADAYTAEIKRRVK